MFPCRRYLRPLREGAVRTVGFMGRHTSDASRAMAHTTLAETQHVDERSIGKQLSHEEENRFRRAYNRAESWERHVEAMRSWANFLGAQTTRVPD